MPACRCTRCGTRRTLAKHPDEYYRMPSCPTTGCTAKTWRQGLRQRWRVDTWRHLHEIGSGAPRPCNCRGGYYSFPHRRGSKWCEHANWSADDAEQAFGSAPPAVVDDTWWQSDPLCFGQRPTTSVEPPF